jgi:hypothetical protein
METDKHNGHQRPPLLGEPEVVLPLLEGWPDDLALGQPSGPAPDRATASTGNAAVGRIPFTGDLEFDKRLVTSRNIARSIRHGQVTIFSDISRGLQNTELRTNIQIGSHCSRHQDGHNSGQFAFADVTHLTRYLRFLLATASHPFVLSGKGSVMIAVARVETFDYPTLFPSGFDPTVPWEKRGGPFVLTTGNPELSGLFAGSLAETLPAACPLLGAHFAEPAARHAYAFLVIPLTLGEIARSCYGFVLQDAEVRKALEARLLKAQNQPAKTG